MDDCEISVIIPVYKIEIKYLNRSIASVLKNHDINLEILLICNGAEEKLRKYCKENYRKEEKIKIYELNEANVSKARNLGIQKASGKYIAFVDADDYVEANMFSTLYNDALKSEADLILCDYFREQGNLIQREGILEKWKQGIQNSNAELIRSLIGDGDKVMMGSVWRCLFRKKMLLSNDIEFAPSLSIGEDFLFILEVLNRGVVTYIEHSALYHYLLNQDSASMSINEKKWIEYEKFLEKLYEYIKSNMNIEEYQDQIIVRIRITSAWIAGTCINLPLSFPKKVQLFNRISRSKRRLENKVLTSKNNKKQGSDGVFLFLMDKEWGTIAVLYMLIRKKVKEMMGLR